MSGGEFEGEIANEAEGRIDLRLGLHRLQIGRLEPNLNFIRGRVDCFSI